MQMPDVRRPQPIRARSSIKLALIGLACLAVAMNAAVLLVTEVLFGQETVVITTVVMACLYIGLWFGLGLTRRLTGERSH